MDFMHHLLASERPRTLYTYAVSGAGQFPYDMLRYDECWPVNDQGSAGMNVDWAGGKRDILMRSYKEPTMARWNSFNWRVERHVEKAKP